MPELSTFRTIDCPTLTDDFLFVLPMSQLQTLVIPLQSFSESILNIQLSSIVHLSISECDLDVVFNLFNNSSKLNYLKIKRVLNKDSNSTTDDVRCITNSASNLKTLRIDYFESEVHYLFMLLKNTPNLEILKIFGNNDANMINANKWQNLITTSLPRLNDFQFDFHVHHFPQSDIKEQNLKEFQTDFWYNEHHWYTEYLICSPSAYIHTNPYPFDTCKFPPRHHRFYYESINIFDNVKYLAYYPEIFTECDQYYFPNIDFLTLGDQYFSCFHNGTMNSLHLKCIQTQFNLSHIKHLNISNGFRFETRDIFEGILKSTTQLSSLRIDLHDLINWLDDDEICQYLHKRIVQLDILYDSHIHSHQLQRFCQIFEHIEQLKCALNKSDTLFLIKHLSKLIHIETNRCLKNHQLSLFKKEVEKLGIDITTDFDNDHRPRRLFIWINRNK